MKKMLNLIPVGIIALGCGVLYCGAIWLVIGLVPLQGEGLVPTPTLPRPIIQGQQRPTLTPPVITLAPPARPTEARSTQEPTALPQGCVDVTGSGYVVCETPTSAPNFTIIVNGYPVEAWIDAPYPEHVKASIVTQLFSDEPPLVEDSFDIVWDNSGHAVLEWQPQVAQGDYMIQMEFSYDQSDDTIMYITNVSQ